MPGGSAVPGRDVGQLIDIFDGLFADGCNTRLSGGADEPLYLPASQAVEHHQLIFREDFFSSALHEISHWCIAGEARRQKVDFGYWYHPDGRTQEIQRSFEQVEVKPQALEWIFSVAANHQFYLSADNLAGDCGASDDFVSRVCEQAGIWCRDGLPQRAAFFTEALAAFYGVPDPLHEVHYKESPR